MRITHDWVERSASRPPEAPPAPIFPPDGGEAEGTDLVFRWLPAKDPDGDRIADYHFELSERPDMKWPLSTNFYKLISNTPDRGKIQYTLPHGGLLASDQKYYWRVRAKNDKRGLGPLEFDLELHAARTVVADRRDARLRCGTERRHPALEAQAPTGRKPAKYRIYGSDEKGFSISDEPFEAIVGTSKEVPAKRPANFVAEVSATEVAVIGAGSQACRTRTGPSTGSWPWTSKGSGADRPTSPSRRGRFSIRGRSSTRKWDPSIATRWPPSARSETSGRAWSPEKRR